MFGNRQRRRLGRVIVAGFLVLLATGVAACASTAAPQDSSSASSAVQPGGTVTYALEAGDAPDYIFPFVSNVNDSVFNTDEFQDLMYRPLYMFGNNGTSVAINIPLSPANAPVYTDGGKTLTITMKGWKWSNGESVDAQDVVFWLNMLEAEKANYYGYAPGLMPDNIVSYSATGPNTVVLHLNRGYSDLWYTYNQLAEITPFPESWDITRAGAAPGSGGCATDTAADKWAKCAAVYSFLINQAKSPGTYASNPVWQVSDGAFKLSYFNTNGNATFVPNTAYSGSPKPTISQFKLVPFTSDSAEYTALKTGQLTVGYIPSQDLPQKPVSQVLPSTDPLGDNFMLEPNYSDEITYFLPNYNNPTMGAVFKQLYVRQALQETVDQNGIDAAIYRGYGYPTSGPVPAQPTSQWIPRVQESNSGEGPYPFDIAKAKSLLTSHGWSETDGVMVCRDPAKCGAGIAEGTKLSFTIDYAAAQPSNLQAVAQVYKSDASLAGIQVNLVGQSFLTVIGEATPCSGPGCTWDSLLYGGWVFNGPGYEPTGDSLFESGAGSNAGSYSNSTVDALISQTHTSSSLSIFDQYATYTAEQAPSIWIPTQYTIQAVGSNLKGVTFNPVDALLPEYWYYTK
ncbi:MAG TPA: ABC transporter substrate-binding protein [Trebonia sp.]|jgi:peptide/nickel transport system substrate-binding protein|nr:ABC transporter substrate-binding protein [Trebonia sp.]